MMYLYVNTTKLCRLEIKQKSSPELHGLAEPTTALMPNPIPEHMASCAMWIFLPLGTVHQLHYTWGPQVYQLDKTSINLTPWATVVLLNILHPKLIKDSVNGSCNYVVGVLTTDQNILMICTTVGLLGLYVNFNVWPLTIVINYFIECDIDKLLLEVDKAGQLAYSNCPW